MNKTDLELENEEVIMGDVVLQRVINAKGVPYSLILEDGVEVFSCERGREADMIECYKETRGKNKA